MKTPESNLRSFEVTSYHDPFVSWYLRRRFEQPSGRMPRDGPGKPWCPSCGAHRLTTLDTPTLRATWAEAEGLQWAWAEGSLAYWFLCKECHVRQSPGDRRCQGPNCRPGVAVWKRDSSKSVLSLLCGDLYLTKAPPELNSAFPARRVRRQPLETWTPALVGVTAPLQTGLRRLPCKRRRDRRVAFAAPAAKPCPRHESAPEKCSHLVAACKVEGLKPWQVEEMETWERECCEFGSQTCGWLAGWQACKLLAGRPAGSLAGWHRLAGFQAGCQAGRQAEGGVRIYLYVSYIYIYVFILRLLQCLF